MSLKSSERHKKGLNIIKKSSRGYENFLFIKVKNFSTEKSKTYKASLHFLKYGSPDINTKYDIPNSHFCLSITSLILANSVNPDQMMRFMAV